MKKNIPPAVAKSVDENATSRAPRSGPQVAAIKYKAQAKGQPNIRGLPSFMHGKRAGRSMILSQQ